MDHKKWKDLSFWPPDFYHFYEREDIEVSDLCGSCAGYGHDWPDDAEHPFCGGACVKCEGTGLKPGEKRQRMLLIHQVTQSLNKDTAVGTLNKILQILNAE